MKSISLAEFVEENDVASAAAWWGVKRQAIESCLKTGRDVRFIEIDGRFEVHEHKVLKSYKASRRG